jgi:AraC family transcriptional regulator of adaptative response/methylated-DNA-[protein]-cysteine methyltransferase
MQVQNDIDYLRVAKAIEFLRLNFKMQPSLEEAAAHVNLSAFHFQRLFKDWAGVSPKQFVSHLTIEHAKKMLQNDKSSLLDIAYNSGLSGSGRLHDLFVKMEGMTPGEYKNGGQELIINYSFCNSPFGRLLVASTTKGICYMAFAEGGEAAAMGLLKQQFAKANYTERTDAMQENAVRIFSRDWSNLDAVRLHLKGTPFQLKVWQTLLTVPFAGLTTYSTLAGRLGNAGAARAVGSAVGNNPVAYLIPCHRVIRSTGEIGDYHWGPKVRNVHRQRCCS